MRDKLLRLTICKWFGHKWGIKGLTRNFDWCGRCASRRNNETGKVTRSVWECGQTYPHRPAIDRGQ